MKMLKEEVEEGRLGLSLYNDTLFSPSLFAASPLHGQTWYFSLELEFFSFFIVQKSDDLKALFKNEPDEAKTYHTIFYKLQQELSTLPYAKKVDQ